MNSEALGSLVVRDLWKTFLFYRKPSHRLVCWFTRGRFGAPEPFHALRGLSVELAPGTSMGIIGANGAGKSTLLKVLTGTLEPTRGSVAVRGRVASLLELGTGFHPLFTGRQNIFYNARFLGLTEEEIRDRLPEIEHFSELGHFLDRPLRTYSSGMQLRLAFAVAASVSPDILIVDEVLAVGDAYFQQKCVRRIRQFRDAGVTILFVSHDPSAVTTLCQRALLLHAGRILDDGPPAAVLGRYNALIARKKAETEYLFLETRDQDVHRRRSGSFEALIREVELLDAEGHATRALLSGTQAMIRVRVFFLVAMTDPTVGILIRDRLGNDVYGTNTYLQGIQAGQWHAGEMLEVRFHLALDIGPGEYSLTAATHTLGAHINDSYDWLESAFLFRILPFDERGAIGVAYLRPSIEIARSPEVVGAEEVIGAVLGEPPSTLSVDQDGSAFLRAGWHAVEGDGAEAFRWTDRECTVFLSLSGSGLGFEVAADRPPGAPPVELRVLSLDRELGRLRLEPSAGWRQVTVPLPPDQPRGPAHLRLVVSDGWRPVDTGHGLDARTLGIRVRRIWSAP